MEIVCVSDKLEIYLPNVWMVIFNKNETKQSYFFNDIHNFLYWYRNIYFKKTAPQ